MMARYQLGNPLSPVEVGTIVAWLGSLTGEKAVSMIAIHAHDIPHVFPADALAEAEAAQPAATDGREDWRDLPLVTIDPADAKDHDDAVFAIPDPDQANPGGVIVTVAIADVAAYVRPGSPLDREALRRGNSVYFPDRVVPMLPERISNDLCSLKEGVDRPALAVRMTFDAGGRKLRHGFHRVMMKSAARSSDMIVAQYSGLWAREGDTFLNAQAGHERGDENDRWLELNDVRLFEFDDSGRLTSVAHARAAEHRSTGWLLRDVTRTYFEERSVRQVGVAEEHWESSLDSAALAANASNIWRPRYMSSADLKQGIDYRKRNQLDASEFEEYYWGQWFYPLNVLALCLAAIPFAFGSLRSGGLGRRLFIGVVFALGFWLLQTQVVKLAAVYRFDYRIAYLVPPVIMLVVSWFLFRRRSG